MKFIFYFLLFLKKKMEFSQRFFSVLERTDGQLNGMIIIGAQQGFESC